MYLLFQLKSHAYMYESTPQHIIDEAAIPGPIAHWMDSSSSSEDDSSGSDSDTSHDSNTTAGRIKRVMRGGRKRRKSSAGSTEQQHPTRTPSYTTSNNSPLDDGPGPSMPSASPTVHRFGAIDMGDEAIEDGVHGNRSRSHSFQEIPEGKPKKERRHKKKKRHMKKKEAMNPLQETSPEILVEQKPEDLNEPRRVDFAVPQDLEAQQTKEQMAKRPFTFRGMSIRPALVPTVFTQPESPHLGAAPAVTGPIPRVRYGIRRTNSLPDRLNQTSIPGPSAMAVGPAASIPIDVLPSEYEEDNDENISRTTAVILLLVSTGLVATCAEFMVASIGAVTSTTALGETFVGLIILPIVGNAAEHVTAVTVAAKNKMDLAIGVAVGSSIQIGMFSPCSPP